MATIWEKIANFQIPHFPRTARSILWFYFYGAMVHTSAIAYRDAKRSLLAYHAAKQKEEQTPYASDFEAFWGGFRRSLWIRSAESALWPVKLAVLVVFAVHREGI